MKNGYINISVKITDDTRAISKYYVDREPEMNFGDFCNLYGNRTITLMFQNEPIICQSLPRMSLEPNLQFTNNNGDIRNKKGRVIDEDINDTIRVMYRLNDLG